MTNFDASKIPIWLRRTPAQQADDRALQERLRTAQGPGRRQTPTEAHLIRAAAVKRAAEAELEQLNRDENPNPLHIENALKQLADAVAAEGNFIQASEMHPDPVQAERYQKIAEAIERDDGDPGCNCEAKQGNDPATGQNVVMTPEIISELVFSPKHDKLMPLVLCAACGDMNVKAAPAHLEERQRAIQEAHRAERERRRK